MASDSELSALDTYIATLTTSSERTRRAEDRSHYRDHLANAAILFHLLHCGDIVGVRDLVSTEPRSYGNDYLSGDEGAAAEAAFAAFAAFTRGL